MKQLKDLGVGIGLACLCAGMGMGAARAQGTNARADSAQMNRKSVGAVLLESLQLFETGTSLQLSTLTEHQYANIYDPATGQMQLVKQNESELKTTTLQVLPTIGINIPLYRLGTMGMLTYNQSAQFGFSLGGANFIQIAAPHYLMAHWGLESSPGTTNFGGGIGIGGFVSYPLLGSATSKVLYVPVVMAQGGFAGSRGGLTRLRLTYSLMDGEIVAPSMTFPLSLRMNPGVMLTLARVVNY